MSSEQIEADPDPAVQERIDEITVAYYDGEGARCPHLDRARQVCVSMGPKAFPLLFWCGQATKCSPWIDRQLHQAVPDLEGIRAWCVCCGGDLGDNAHAYFSVRRRAKLGRPLVIRYVLCAACDAAAVGQQP